MNCLDAMTHAEDETAIELMFIHSFIKGTQVNPYSIKLCLLKSNRQSELACNQPKTRRNQY